MMRDAAWTSLLALVTALAPASARPAADAAQDGADHPKIIVVDTRDLLRDGGENDIVAATVRALAQPSARTARSFDVWESSQFDATLSTFFHDAPPVRNTAPVRDGAEAERAALQAELDACTASGTGSFCRRTIAATDYENVLADAAVTPVSIERARLVRTIRPADRRRLEIALTALMEHIRAQMTTAAATPLRPVRVVIGARGSLNIGAAYGSDTLTLPEDVVRDVLVRAFFRAAHGLRDRNTAMDALDDCSSCDAASEQARLFSLDLPRFLHLVASLPGLRMRHISPGWFVRAVRAGCAPLAPDVDAGLTQIAAAPDEDLRSAMPAPELRRLGLCARDGTTRLSAADLDTYLREAMEADANEPDDLESYVAMLSEGASMKAALSAELAKSLLFLMAHESQHLWISPDAGPNAEFAADAHAATLYLALFQEIDPDQWFRSAGLPGVRLPGVTGEGADASALFRSILGRDPGVLLREIYRGTAYYDGEWSHPPVEQRVARIQQTIKAGRLAFTCDKINEIIRQAQAAKMPAPVDASTCTS